MGYGEMGNLDNFTFEEDAPAQKSTVHEAIPTVACLAGIVANSFIIHIIFRFEKMRTLPNILLANWAIADLCALVFTPSLFRLISVIGDFWLPAPIVCFIFQVTDTAHLIMMWFAILVAIDWYAVPCFEKMSERLRHYYKFIIAVLWTFALLFASITGGLCLFGHFIFMQSYMMFVSYCAILLLIVSLHWTRAMQKYRSKFVDYPSLMLTLVSALAMCWFSFFLGFILYYSGVSIYPMFDVVEECFNNCSSIVTLILLYNLSKEFRICFLQTLRLYVE